jgi:hypothetical protein
VLGCLAAAAAGLALSGAQSTEAAEVDVPNIEGSCT